MTALHALAPVLILALTVAQRFALRDLLLGGAHERSSARKQKVVLTVLGVLLPVEVVGIVVLLVRELQAQGLL